MNYQDEDEENNLFYQKYKKSKSQKEKKENPLVQTEIETTTINLQRKRQRHDSDSSDNEEENKDNNNNCQTEETKQKIEIEFTNNKNKVNPIHNNIPEEISNEIFNKKDPKKEKIKKITKNYENLATWMKGIIKFEEKEKQKAAEDLKKNNEDPMKRILNVHKGLNSNDPIEKKRGFYLPKCKFAMSMNRFGIEPGYRWDGVDRSNGFEKKYFEVKNQKKEKQTEYYKLRTEEM